MYSLVELFSRKGRGEGKLILIFIIRFTRASLLLIALRL